MKSSLLPAIVLTGVLSNAIASHAAPAMEPKTPPELEITPVSRVPVIHFSAAYNVQRAQEFAEKGQLGSTKLHLERARWARPYDLEIQRGLKLVNWHVQRDRMERFPDARLTQGEPRTLWTWRVFNAVPTRVWAITLMATVWVSCALLMLRRSMTKSLRRDAVGIGSIASVTIASCAAVGWLGCIITGANLRPAVVVGSNVMAWSAPDAMVTPQNNPDLYEGAVVLVKSEEGDWVELQLADSERVWTKRDNIRHISAHQDTTLRVD